MKDTKPKKKRLSFGAFVAETIEFDEIPTTNAKSPISSDGQISFDSSLTSPSSFITETSNLKQKSMANIVFEPEKSEMRRKSFLDIFSGTKKTEESPKIKRSGSIFARKTIKIDDPTEILKNVLQVIEKMEDEEKSTVHTDYHKFVEVDLDDYSHVKKPISWNLKKFDHSGEELEQQTTNPLFEEFEEMLNPLFDDFETFENPLADPLFEFINPLLDSGNFLSDLSEVRGNVFNKKFRLI
jgi:hypothetical protein